MKNTSPWPALFLSKHIIFLFVVGTMMCSPNGFSARSEETAFIDNGVVRLGVDLSAGGSIFHFGPSGTNSNLLNHYDKGRFIQQSYYGREDGSKWVDKPWRWNPVQGGGYRDEPADVLEKEITDTHMQIVSVPRHFRAYVLSVSRRRDRGAERERLFLFCTGSHLCDHA